jgi:two-component system alkaline phosphatase synthesis response regulator PhoP
MSKILIVDDSPNTCTLLKSFLEEINHTVFVSYDEIDALKKIENLKPDIIILDLVMGEIGGMEVLKQVRQFDKKAGIIMISGLTNESTCTESLETGADMYITKPVDYYHLATNILPHLIKIKELN